MEQQTLRHHHKVNLLNQKHPEQSVDYQRYQDSNRKNYREMNPWETIRALHMDPHIRAMRKISPPNEADYEWRKRQSSAEIMQMMSRAVGSMPWPSINERSRATALATSLPNGNRCTIAGLTLNDLKSLSIPEQNMRLEAAKRAHNQIGRSETPDIVEHVYEIISQLENEINNAQETGLIGIYDERETRVFWTPTPQGGNIPGKQTPEEGTYLNTHIIMNGDRWKVTWQEKQGLCQVCNRPFEVAIDLESPHQTISTMRNAAAQNVQNGTWNWNHICNQTVSHQMK